jgi:mevalonate kinase
MKARIITLLNLVQGTYDIDLYVAHHENVIVYTNDGTIITIELMHDDIIFHDGDEVSYNELVNILTNDNPYSLL